MADKLEYHIKELIKKNESFVVAKIVNTDGSAPRKSGAIMLMTKDKAFKGTVGGGKIEQVVQEFCKKTMGTKEKNKVRHFKLKTEEKGALDMGCGGEADVLITYVDSENAKEILSWFEVKATAYIFGAGHVAKALEPVLRHVDFNTVVIDDREEYANKDRYPYAKKVLVVENFEKSFENIACDKNSYIVIVTRGHMGDYEVLKDAIEQECAYLGMIGSKNKSRMLFDMLKENGCTQEKIHKIYAPIGENIFAETPEEIAISIAAEMIKVRAGHGTR